MAAATSEDEKFAWAKEAIVEKVLGRPVGLGCNNDEMLARASEVRSDTSDDEPFVRTEEVIVKNVVGGPVGNHPKHVERGISNWMPSVRMFQFSTLPELMIPKASIATLSLAAISPWYPDVQQYKLLEDPSMVAGLARQTACIGALLWY